MGVFIWCVIGLFATSALIVFVLLLSEMKAISKSHDNLCSCGSLRITNDTTVIVWGHQITLNNSPQCKICTEATLEQYATCCDFCKQPICPGQLVTSHGNHRYTHADQLCSGENFIISGIWGKGRLDEYQYS